MRTSGVPPGPGPRARSWLPVGLWAALIFGFSSVPNLRFLPDEGLDFVVRKIGHMGVFGVLALLAWYALERTAEWRWAWAWALALSVLYAISDEVHQAFVSGRHPSPVDVGIDTAGMVIALVAVGVLRVRLARRERR